MKVFIFMIICGYAAGAIFQQPLIRVESRKTKMMKNGIWNAYFKDKQLLQRSFNDDNLQHYNDYDEVEYIANISIGIPAQAFKMHLDVTSDDFWIPDITCGTTNSTPPYCPSFCLEPGSSSFCGKGCGNATENSETICNQKAKFDSSRSETYVNNENKRFNIDYEFGYVTISSRGQDIVQLGPVSARETYFSQATGMSPVFSDAPFDGILGIEDMSYYLKSIATQLDKEIYTVYLQDTYDKYDVIGGYITFGGLDVEHCSADIDYENTLTPYKFGFFDMSYGSLSIQGTGPITVDTSRTSLVGPIELVEKIKIAAGATKNGTIDCTAKIDDITLKTLHGKDDYKTFTIPAKNLIIHNNDGSCSIAVEAMPPYFSYQWIFGTPWFRSYCTTFHSAESEGTHIAFAQVIA